MNQLKQVAEIQNIKGNELMLLHSGGFESIYQAKKESHLNAQAIYEYLLKEVNDKIKKENGKLLKVFKEQAKITAIQKFNAEIEKIEKEIKVKEEAKRIKKETKKQEKKDKNSKAKYPYKAMISANVMILFKKKDTDGNTKISKPYYTRQATLEYLTSDSHLQQLLNLFSFEDYAKIQSLQSYNIANLDIESIKKHRKPKVKHLMKKGYILRNDW